jgi:hypothetical protein
MRYIYILFVLFVSTTAVFLSCKKYVDKKATPDPRLTTHYCNDPDAVNYNWGFPGVPDNQVCFYPTDVFKGVYEFHDSVQFKITGYFVKADTLELTITKGNNTRFTIGGFCASGGLLSLTAGVNFFATLDTTMGDSTTQIRGQAFCMSADTVNGSLVKDRLNDSLLYITLEVAADTGVTTIHTGTARLKHR